MHLRIRPVPFQHDFCHRRHRRKNQKWLSPPAISDVAQIVVGRDLLGGGQSHRHHCVMECRHRFVGRFFDGGGRNYLAMTGIFCSEWTLSESSWVL